MLNLRIEDRNPHLKDELHEIMVENKDIFQSVLNGEDEYADSLGWFSVDKWASHEEVQKLKKLAAHIRENADAFVIIGVGGSNNAARRRRKIFRNDSSGASSHGSGGNRH